MSYLSSSMNKMNSRWRPDRSEIRAICMSGILEHHAAIRGESKEIERSEQTREACRIPLRGYLAACLPAYLVRQSIGPMTYVRVHTRSCVRSLVGSRAGRQAGR